MLKGLLQFSIIAVPFFLDVSAFAAAPANKEQPVERICEADIYYTWKRNPTAAETAQANDSKTPPPPVIEPVEVFHMRIGARGVNLDDVKAELSRRLPEAKGAALKSCSEQHQDLTSCVASGFTKMEHSFNNLDFESRRALRKTITKNCETGSGICLSTRSGDISCYENRPPEIPKPTPTSEAKTTEVEDDSKDKKKKKKKRRR